MRKDRAEALLRKGYFPSQLPPTFTTEIFASNCKELIYAWKGIQSKQNDEKCGPSFPQSKPELFSVARDGHRRRITSIPNPIVQAYLSIEIGRYWGDILKHFRKSRFSISKPRFKRGTRAVSIPSMQTFYEKKILRGAGFRYVLVTDISRFFPTIYTHSIPWALHTKDTAKSNQGSTREYYGTILDRVARLGQQKQTIGIPIGPDTSHVIAEIVATSVDIEFKEQMTTLPVGFRFVDDYVMFFSTLAEADAALAGLMRALQKYELQINFDKTRIEPIKDTTEDYWPRQLQSATFRKSGKFQAYDLNYFFELAFDLSKKNSDERVMTYALKCLSSEIVKVENWELFESQLCRVALGYPNSLQTIARLFCTYQSVGYEINRSRLGRVVNAIVEERAPLGHHCEVAWALWMCKDLDLKLNDKNIDLICQVPSSICALLLLDLSHSGKIEKKLNVKNWENLGSTEALREEMWLLSYEAGIRGWGGFSAAHIQSDHYFSEMLKREIRFYDEDAKLIPYFTISSEMMKERSVETPLEFLKLLNVDSFIEFDEENDFYGSIESASEEDITQEESDF